MLISNPSTFTPTGVRAVRVIFSYIRMHLYLFYSIYLGPLKIKKKHPTKAKKDFFFGAEARLQPFCFSKKRRCQDPEVKRPFDLLVGRA